MKITNGSAADTYIDYMNKTAKRLEKKGYTCRMWNDEIYRTNRQHIGIKRSINIVFWTDKYAPFKKYKNKGYGLYNAVSRWTYYVTIPSYKYVYSEPIYNRWKPKNFAAPGEKKKTCKSGKFKGAYFCIWCDYPSAKTQSEVWGSVDMRMWSNSIKMWNCC